VWIPIIQDGNVMNMPNLMAQDVWRAYELYSNMLEFMWGIMTHKKVG